MVRRRILLVCVLFAGVAGSSGCEAIASIRGLIAVAGELQEHLEKDLKTELTDAKIDKVLEVTPDLKAFSETAKVKWKPDPESADFQQLANALGGLADYISFFESKDTRITEYYVDLIKIYDARAVITLRKAQAEAREKLEKEKAELEAKRASASPEEVKKLEEELKRNELALEKVEEMVKTREDSRKKQGQYALSNDEIALVEARLEEIDRVFEDAGYIKTDKKKEAADQEGG